MEFCINGGSSSTSVLAIAPAEVALLEALAIAPAEVALALAMILSTTRRHSRSKSWAHCPKKSSSIRTFSSISSEIQGSISNTVTWTHTSKIKY